MSVKFTWNNINGYNAKFVAALNSENLEEVRNLCFEYNLFEASSAIGLDKAENEKAIEMWLEVNGKTSHNFRLAAEMFESLCRKEEEKRAERNLLSAKLIYHRHELEYKKHMMAAAKRTVIFNKYEFEARVAEREEKRAREEAERNARYKERVNEERRKEEEEKRKASSSGSGSSGGYRAPYTAGFSRKEGAILQLNAHLKGIGADILPLNPTSSEIRQARIALSKAFHPDVAGYGSTQRMQEINNLLDMLK